MLNMLEGILRRPRTVVTMMIVVIAAGIMSYISIPKEANPDIDVPVFYVSVTQQGISPEDAERLLVRPMETSLRGLDGLKEITAVASEGHAGIILEFDIDFDKDEALSDVRDKVDEAKSELPDDADEPTITETNFALVPTITVAVSGNVPERTLYRYAKRLQDEIETVPSVLEANLKGHREEMLEVIIDMAKLESYAITQQDLLTSLSNNNRLVPAGFLDTGAGRFNVKVPGLVENAVDVYNLPIKQSGEGVVILGDVAEIRRTFKDPTVFTRVNGQPAIAIDVVKRLGTNIIENNQAVRDVVAAASTDIPAAIQVDYLLDQSDFIYEVLGSLQSSIMTAILLVMIVVLAALGLRSSLLVGLAIPTSFMTGFLILSMIGMTVNMMVMFGLVLTVGMLVDGAIVVTEYADRKLQEGMAKQEAYIRAAKLMFWPVVSSTATTLAAFLPMLLWPGVPGEFMSYLPIMVIIVLTASLVTAMIFLPVTGALTATIAAWMSENAASLVALAAGTGAAAATYMGLQPLAGALASGNGPVSLPAIIPEAALSLLVLIAAVAIGSALFLVSRPLFRRISSWSAARKSGRENSMASMLAAEADFDPEKIPGFTGSYVRFLRGLTGSLVGNIAAVGVIAIVVVSIFYGFASNPTGVEFFVEEEPDQTVVMISGRGNLSAEEALSLVQQVESEVIQINGIENVVTAAYPTGGSGGGNDAIGGVQDKPSDLIGELNLEMVDFAERRPWSMLVEEIRTNTAGIPGIRVEPRIIEGGPPTGKDVNLEIRSTSYDTLLATTKQVRTMMDNTSGLIDIEDNTPLPGIEWELEIDREEAGRFNAGIGSVGNMIQLVTNGVWIGDYRPDDSDDEVEIRVRLPEDERQLGRLDELRLQTPNGLVPIANFVSRTAQPKVSSITRVDGLYTMNVKATVDPAAGQTIDQKVGEIQELLDAQTWPDNIFFRFRGADEEQKESGEFLMKAMVASLFIMAIILITQFNSFWQTSITLLTIILAASGALVGMILTGQKFSIIMTGTGIIALAGIVVNNAIVLIDTYNRMRSDGVDPREAVLKTAAQRLRPILLTTITTIAGLIPMATQINLDFFTRTVAIGSVTSIWWVQLSTAVIFGLAFSTVLTLIMVPVLLAFPENLKSLFRRFQKTDAGSPEASKTDQQTEADVDELAEARRRRALPNYNLPQAAE